MKQNVDMSNMFRNCDSLIGIDINNGGYTFVEDEQTYTFSNHEIARLKRAISAFTFEGKDIKRLRKITNTYINKYHPEDLL